VHAASYLEAAGGATGRIRTWSRVLLEKLTVAQLVKEFLHLLWNLKFHYHVHINLPLGTALSQLNSRPVIMLYSVYLLYHMTPKTGIASSKTAWGPSFSVMSSAGKDNMMDRSPISGAVIMSTGLFIVLFKDVFKTASP
jgi:hypothetical protein